VDRVLARKCQLFGITVPSYEVLHTVKHGPKPMSAYALAHILGREHHSIVELINRLKAKGLITRTQVDGRPSLDVTESGSDLLVRMASTMPVIEDLFESMEKANIDKLRKGLTSLREEALHQLGLVDMGEIKLSTGDGSRKSATGKKPAVARAR
jgi:DNA-binding MarR family transcriptional regulator